MDKYIFFPDFKDLIMTLYLLYPGGQRFPEKVFELAGENNWALPLTCFKGDLESMRRFCNQCGWKVSFKSDLPANARETPLLDIVYEKWYSVPSLLSSSEPNPKTLSSGLSPGLPDLEYILAAKNERQAEHILKVLTDCLSLGIEARPVLPQNDGQEHLYKFFWSVNISNIREFGATTEEIIRKIPPLSVIYAADRVWCGPIRIRREQVVQKIYLQWPYDIRIPFDILSKINWGQSNQVILLSIESPYRIVLRDNKEIPIFKPLPVVADLKIQKEPITIINCDTTPSAQPNFKFQVDLKLIEQDESQSAANWIKQLEWDIKSQQTILEKVKDMTGYDDEESDIFFEPLFIYYDRRGKIPFELQRILLEWSDQIEDIRSLWYMKLDSSTMPSGVIWDEPIEGYQIHILSTAAAFGKNQPEGVGLRLRQYIPVKGNHVRYKLMPQWDRFGLRLFVPYDRELDIYPQLHPGTLAADKLSQALLPKGKDSRNFWCAILLPGKEKHVRAFQLPIEGFKPLIESFEWDCNIDLGVRNPTVTESDIKQIRSQFVESVFLAFKGPAGTEALKRLEREKTELAQSIEQITTQLEGRRKINTSFRNHLHDIEQVNIDTSNLLKLLKRARSQLGNNLHKISRDNKHITQVLEHFKSLNDDITLLQAQYHSLEKKYDNLMKDIKS